MLFNSFAFVLGFLPAAAVVFFLLGRFSPLLATGWLAVASLAFYGWWDVRYLPLLVGSILFNYAIGWLLARRHGRPEARALLAVGVAGDLLILAYYKYAGLFLSSLDAATGAHLPVLKVLLPLGISFFTFTQIAFLVDVSRGLAAERRFDRYALFVTYFPHLIAGPVIHHKQVMPQFAAARTFRPDPSAIALGSVVFVVGLAKKVLLADTFAAWASPVFNGVHAGAPVDFGMAWTGALSYALQIYFDFSGYSDMAVGLSLMFNVKLPWNFASPYKSRDISEFWRRWHITLSTFLRDYLYIPLGGNRKGPARRYVNLMTTMVLGGLWHGASWTFVAWGALHGAYLVVNHGFDALAKRAGFARSDAFAPRLAGAALTFLAVVVAWVFFRAQSFGDAFAILRAMAGASGFPASASGFAEALSQRLGYDEPLARLGAGLGLGLLIAWAAPNTQRIAGAGAAAIAERRYLVMGACAAAVLLLLIIGGSRGPSEFIYFNF